MANRWDKTLKGRNLFIFLSFLGIGFLGCVLVGFWYLTEPRLRQIFPGLPMLLGIALLFFYLVVVGLFSLIVVSSYIGKDLVSAKKITVRILLPLASALGRVLGVESEAIRSSFIEMNNSLVRASARLVGGDRLLLLLPHCLQSFDCPHKVTSEVRNCHRCGGCEIADLIAMCDACGVKMSIATGGTLARRVIVETRPTAIVAVACDRDLTSGIQDSYPIPVIGVLNERPFGPCKNTRVDLAKVRAAMDFFLQPGAARPARAPRADDHSLVACGDKSGKSVGSRNRA
ncbi:MAG TPA: DUF116 domain-containing protein [bacterium]|nr:DUF116 domain-containing protein [bacterium]